MLAQSGGRDYVSIVLQYASERGELKNKQAFFELINTQISSEVGETIMTLAEQLKADGKLEGKLEVAQRLLAEGAEADFIARITGVYLWKGLKELKKKRDPDLCT